MNHKLAKRLFCSLALVLVWLSFVVEGSHALFSDSATLSGNSFVSGTATLEISNSQNQSSTLYAKNRPGFTYALSPGGSEEKYFFLRNVSSDVTFDISVFAQQQSPEPNLPHSISLEFTCLDSSGAPISSPVRAVLETMMTSSLGLNCPVGPGVSQRYKIRTFLDGSYTEQARSLAYDLVFTGLQHL